MDAAITINLDHIFSHDRALQNPAYDSLLKATEPPVDWAYEIWDRVTAGLTDKDNLVRAITSQVLCNLAKSDPDKRILKDFAALLTVTKDERFVTARHCMQSLWKIGILSKEHQQVYMEGLTARFRECVSEKNATLIRFDILQSMRNVYDAAHDDAIRTAALALIETEDDLKYRKKYAGVWNSNNPLTTAAS